MILNKIDSLKDLKALSIDEMNTLSDEMRKLIIEKVNYTGGHMAPNLGIVETTIALHYVFNSPIDKFVFDVSHQCYPHKILTGRKDGFINLVDYLKYTGYTAPEESEHDMFKVGHTSTSISLAAGLAKARDLKNENYNIIALIGDGSLSGGEALEGLNFASKLNSNFIIIVNDNQMSIAQNYGGLYDNLKLLRETKGKAENNFFKVLGYDYLFIEEGNNIEILIEEFKNIKDAKHPLVVHLCTEKGRGLKQAVDNKEKFHWVMPNVLDEQPINCLESYTTITVDYFLKKAKQDSTFAVVNAATPGAFGLVEDVRKELGEQFIDVAIAEEHAIGMISGMAKNGAKPVFCVMSSFIQRTYDQLSQDLCLNSNPATILIYWGGITEADATHLTTFDISMMSNIPNLVYLAPTTKEEYLKMLDWSVEQNEHPVAIRVPNIELISSGVEDETDYSILNKYQITKKGDTVALLGLGNFYYKAQEVADYLEEKMNIKATVINPKFITGIDFELMKEIKKNHKVVVTLEDGELDGGWGEKIARYFGATEIKVLNYGSHKEFSDRVLLDELYKKYRLTKELILEDIKKAL